MNLTPETSNPRHDHRRSGNEYRGTQARRENGPRGGQSLHRQDQRERGGLLLGRNLMNNPGLVPGF